MSGNDSSIRILVVDDSLFMRKALSRLINEGQGLSVVGLAVNGREALERINELSPDVVLMDLEMPEMDGLQALKLIMSRHPLPVVIFSSQSKSGAQVTLKCLELGAVDFICKPAGGPSTDLTTMRYIIWQKIRSAAQAKMQQLLFQPSIRKVSLPPTTARNHHPARIAVAIGASTGGPRALLDVLSALSADLPAGVLVVQHMPAHFTTAMAQRLDANCELTVREAQEGEPLLNGEVLVAPGGRHLRLTAEGRVSISDEPPLWGVRPAVDYMMQDCAQYFNARCLGVVLTGMGHDGTAGLANIKQAGGYSLVQDQATSVVYGMPRSAVEAGVADETLPLPMIPKRIMEWGVAMDKSLSREKVKK